MKGIQNLFPVTQHGIYLNNAAESPLNVLVQSRLSEYLNAAAEAPHRKPSNRMVVKELLSKILGGAPSDFALMTSTGMGIGTVAAGYDWQPGDNVVIPADEHWNNAFPWMILKDRGVDVRVVPIGEDKRVTAEILAPFVNERTKMVSVAAVRFNSGYRVNLKAIGELAHRFGALFVVDGIQAAGMVPIHIEDDGIDILAGAGFKWLLGMHGTGYLYIRSDLQARIKPVLPGMFAAKDDLSGVYYHQDARRYETGTIAYGLFHAWTAGLELIEELGIDAIHERNLHLTDHLIKGLQEKHIQILSPIDNRHERSAIVVFTLGTADANEALHRAMDQKRIYFALRGGVCRISPNFFNTEAEIDSFLEALPIV